jgi:hypothetical protein
MTSPQYQPPVLRLWLSALVTNNSSKGSESGVRWHRLRATGRSLPIRSPRTCG